MKNKNQKTNNKQNKTQKNCGRHSDKSYGSEKESD